MASITIPNPLPTPEEDSQNLRKAFQGWGTDEKVIIEILSHRTAAQRVAISETYARLYGESLHKGLHDELSGDFRNAVMLWTTEPAQRDAELVSKALRKIDDRHIYTIIEIACASSPEHLIAVRKAYLSRFSSSIEEDVASKFSAADPLRQLLVLLVSSYRYDGEQVDEVMAKFEAVELRDAIKKNQPHRDEVIRILGTRSKPQLKATFNYYEQNSRDIGQDIKKTSKGQFSSILRAAVWCIGSPEKHFAKVLRSSIEGLGTDESTLNRVIISRAEIDMVKIKDEYKSKYKTTLKADVKGDTSGDYKSFLLALVGDSNT